MMTQFIKYDQDFEYGADLPGIFVRLVYIHESHGSHMTCYHRDWRDCKNALLTRFKTVADNLSSRGEKEGGGEKQRGGEKQGAGEGGEKKGAGEGGELLEILAEVLKGDNSLHNYALLMLWASQSNAVPVSGCTDVFEHSVYMHVQEIHGLYTP